MFEQLLSLFAEWFAPKATQESTRKPSQPQEIDPGLHVYLWQYGHLAAEPMLFRDLMHGGATTLKGIWGIGSLNSGEGASFTTCQSNDDQHLMHLRNFVEHEMSKSYEPTDNV
jgi:hypothetical protein